MMLTFSLNSTAVGVVVVLNVENGDRNKGFLEGDFAKHDLWPRNGH